MNINLKNKNIHRIKIKHANHIIRMLENINI